MTFPQPPVKTLALRLGMLILWCGCILWLSLSPSPPTPPSIFFWDKLQHAAAYALMTFLAGRVLLLFMRPAYRGWLTAMAAAFLFGALTEAAQGMLTTVRLAEPADLLANFIGAAVVAAGAIGLRLWRRRFDGRVGG